MTKKTNTTHYQVPGANINSITEELSRKGGVRVNHLTLELDVPALADPAKLLYLSQLQLLRVCGLYHNGGDLQVTCFVIFFWFYWWNILQSNHRGACGAYESENLIHCPSPWIYKKLVR